ncbi:Cytochrome bd-I ubiquinol oxidase subunit 2 [Candidatus Kinetoplastibacterium sorsogonicusi]|uniref:Cytochrome bd-I ubiquinol oxidase subunit 2 n=1 Tax=Candidatus Kinetoplastidibacterium kentomonadis TaxID=1576550 RepID=A0A3S7JAM7_9PROT|nr:cytochrome d ubiquinol oxidase subunit II [Candidatus Kinetoplastibacterium sorsogonicusi]AWD32724.1 Cytochrome bd-I ubiquinol oxidase subunit 2 [Candidatus Kinetoplastibacterium sorsogonicusi]
MFLDYDTLRLIWWALLGVLLIGFAVMDGFDLGAAFLLPFVAKNDNERRIVINIVGPVWEGNQVWLITAGGAIFAAWPLLYAASFSGFYLAMILALIALIIRPVGFKYRSKINTIIWRNTWDYLLSISGFIASLVFGVAIGNVMVGVPFKFDPITLRPLYEGNLFQLFTPFTLLCGLLSVFMLSMHGAVLLSWKTNDEISKRSRKYSMIFAMLSIILFILGGVMVYYMNGFIISEFNKCSAPSNPLLKTVNLVKGAWLFNYIKHPALIIVPFSAIISSIFVIIFMYIKKYCFSFVCSSIALSSIILTVGISMFPFLMPSIIDLNSSLTVWDASSSYLTLLIMLIVVIAIMPIVIGYTSFVYYILRGKITNKSISKNPNSY